MTRALEEVFETLQKLSDSEQDAIALMIKEQLEDDALWDQAFAASQDRLAELATQTRDDIREGRTRTVGFDEL